MKHNGIIAIVFVVGSVTGGVAAQLVVPPVRAGTRPTRWEYQCPRVGAYGVLRSGVVSGDVKIETDDSVMSTLTGLGKDGWELVSFAPAHVERATNSDDHVSLYVFCAKRPLP